ncbi:tetratricopeptide repeat protein [Halioglobus maricola]|uniref:Tetratricopeptide repeat protein n=1 Tax=Halioglobus maricola TaxID=2601894 RepID=A0A5P9NN09_9GAMM|nr:tetratricopeptide repeat protein [Halioglobus maricola]QFU77142.1 tetratricopeptide repeat protein [Halioglobus maricola]
MELRQFVSELRSRKVYRTAAVYCAGAWALLQVADVIFPVVGLPDWTVSAVLVIAALGFPLALILSWLFEISPEGKGGTENGGGEATADGQFSSARIIELTLVLILCGLVGYLYVGRLASPPSSAPAEQALAEASIAVMPFVNLSEDTGLEYLGDGLAEEILNLLARINELNVAARTSSFYFKDKDLDIQTVGRRLGVEHVLEGSVRPAGDRVRVTAQLINTEDGFHVWSETYDSSLEDALVFQDEIAAQVVKQLELIISDESRDVLARGEKLDGEGYQFYLRGRAYLRTVGDPENLTYAINLFDKAIAANPEFADPYAGKCEALLGLYSEARAPALFSEAEVACQKALTLDRRSPGVYIGLGNLYLVSGQYQQALTEFDTALALKPGYVEALLGRADAYFGQQLMVEAGEHYRRALALNPDNWRAQKKMGNFLFDSGRPEEAIPYYQRIADLMPDGAGAFNNLGAAYFMTGEYQRAVDAWEIALDLSPSGVTYANVATSLYFMRRYDEALPLYHKAVELSPQDYELWGNLGDVYRYASGGSEMAGPMYENAIKLAEQHLAINENDAHTLALMGHYHAALGDTDMARDYISRALGLAPNDVYVKYSTATALASLGDYDDAMGSLESAMDNGFPMHVALADANLNGLKELPRYEASMAQRE